MRRRAGALLAGLALAGVTTAGCGDGDDGAAGPTPSTTRTTAPGTTERSLAPLPSAADPVVDLPSPPCSVAERLRAADAALASAASDGAREAAGDDWRSALTELTEALPEGPEREAAALLQAAGPDAAGDPGSEELRAADQLLTLYLDAACPTT